MAQKFLVGGSEAPLTPFTIAQMQALKIYSREKGTYPCRALDLEKANNTMVLGEGAGAVCLETGIRDGALACIEGIGWGTEPLQHGASLSAEAVCLQRSMNMAIEGVSPAQVDAVVMHAPGTVKGDRSEFRAIQRVFEGKPPALTTNKWKIGHTLGASGLLSLEMAVLMLEKQEFIGVPYVSRPEAPTHLRYVLVNAVGFGGNAVSVLLGRS
jgi:3-oxoacyl-(acyl-carrier-protein) synthase